MAKKPNKKPKKNHKTKPIKEEIAIEKIPSPEGSVHFDEFLINCKRPKLLPIPPIPIEEPKQGKGKGKKKGKGKGKKQGKGKGKGKPKKAGKKKLSKKKKNAKVAKEKVVVQPDIIPPIIIEPAVFPLIKALLLPTEDGDLVENAIFSEFAVGIKDTSISNNRKLPSKELSVLEKLANSKVDEINEVQANIKVLKEIPKLDKSQTDELEAQQSLLIQLLDDFENYLDKIRKVFNGERVISVIDYNDDDEWADVADEQQSLDGKAHPECLFPLDDAHGKQRGEDNKNTSSKWYEGADLDYLLSPSSSFNKNEATSEDFLRIVNKLNDKSSAQQGEVMKRKELFKRLKEKFSILLPPPKLEVTKEHLVWIDKKLYKEHVSMLQATDNLKLFQCWNHLEFKYDIIDALSISLKDAIKSTSAIYYATDEMKTKFLCDQSELVQTLDDFRRKTKDIYRRAGLEDYWQVHPKSIRLGVKPSFEVTIKQRKSDITNVIQLDEKNLTFLERNLFIPKPNNDNCKKVVKKPSRDSEVEVKVVEFT